jgi:dTDP-4-amino-4,6-dideoxygalactose transaminase
MALLAVGVGRGDEVVTVSHSFIATANAIRYCGAIPVFVDIEPATFNLDPARLAAALSSRTKAVLVVHQMGMPADLAAILPIARTAGVPVIEDAACAVGSEILWNGEWERIGQPHGDIACFSFHPRKVITTGDGGMLTTADSRLDQAFRLLRQHGMSVSDSARHGAKTVIFEKYLGTGFNYRMTDIQAAVGRVQLSRLPELVAERRRLAASYRSRLAAIPGLVLPEEPPWAHSNWQSYCIRLPDGVDQEIVMQHLLDRGIATRRGVMCAHREAAFLDNPLSWQAPGGLAESERAQDRSLILPIYPGITEAELEEIVRTIAEILVP